MAERHVQDNNGGGYAHPIELLTVYLCQFGSEDLLDVPTQYIRENQAALREFRVAKAAVGFVQLHPVRLFTLFKEHLSDAQGPRQSQQSQPSKKPRSLSST